jgi:hypothetical protein
MSIANLDPESWTYGAELEYGDLYRSKVLNDGCKWDVRDFTMVNSNGIAVDPKGKLYPFGGEINTRPTDTIDEQVALFEKLMRFYPEAHCNYRSNLHIHVGIPGLHEDLATLKKIQTYVDEELRWYIDTLEYIPKPVVEDYPWEGSFEGAMKRFHRRQRSHHTFIPKMRVATQMHAKSVHEFLEAEVPRAGDGAVMWHAQPRAAVNLRQLRETKTIEFRHFPGTLDPEEFKAALTWCKEFLHAAINTGEQVFYLGTRLGVQTGALKLPTFRPYVHWMELRYRATTHDGTWNPKQIKEHIEYILNQDAK